MKTYMFDVLEDLPSSKRRALKIVAIIAIAAALLLCAAAYAGDPKQMRTYMRMLPVAYFDGIDNPYKYVGKALSPDDLCDEKMIESLQKQHRISKDVVIGCKFWTPRSDENL